MKKITIEIEKANKNRAQVEAYDVAYPFAVHVSAHDYRRESTGRRWTVTHTPSGLACGVEWSFKQAVALAKKFAAQRFWLTTVPTAWDAATRDFAKSLRDQAFAELGL
jgi:hypothetical protein